MEVGNEGRKLHYFPFALKDSLAFPISLNFRKPGGTFLKGLLLAFTVIKSQFAPRQENRFSSYVQSVNPLNSEFHSS